MKKVCSIFIVCVLLLTFVFIVPSEALTMAIQEIKISGLRAPAVWDEPSEHVSGWKIENTGCYIKDSYSGISTGIYYMDESDNRQPAENFTESDQFVYFIPIGFNSGFSVIDNTKVVLVDCDTPVKTEIFNYPSSNIAQIIVYYDVLPPANVANVTLDANGGTIGGNDTKVIKTNKNGYAAFSETPVREQYEFDGWYTEKTGGTKVDSSYKFLQDTTVYARWIEIISEVHIDNVVLPMPGREPVFTAQTPPEDDYMIGIQAWSTLSQSNITYNDPLFNLTATPLETFVDNNAYFYVAELKPWGNKIINSETDLYLNGVKVDNAITDGSMVVTPIICEEPDEFTVYNGASIDVGEGVSGEELEILLKNYAGGFKNLSGWTLKNSGNKPQWAEVSQGEIKGTREAGESFYFSVETTGEDSVEEVYVSVGKTHDTSYISSQPEDVTTDCGNDATFAVVCKTNPSSTVTYRWVLKFGNTWYNASALASSYGITGYDGPVINIGTSKIFDSQDIRCVVMVDGKMITSDIATLYVNHTPDSIKPMVVDGNTSDTLHNEHCSECSLNCEVPHNEKWMPSMYEGYKYFVCEECGFESSETKVSTANTSTMAYFYKNDGTASSTSTQVKLDSYIDAPVSGYKREGYVFTGWALDKDAEAPDYIRGEKILFGEENMKFYAVWVPQTQVALEDIIITEENMNDVTGFEDITYDMETATLTLDWGVISTKQLSSVFHQTGIYAQGFLEIKLIGDSYITAYEDGAVGIEVDGILKISGDNKLCFEGDADMETEFGSAIKADKVYFAEGFTYIKDCETAVDADAYFMGGICETYIGAYADEETAEKPFCAYTGEIECDALRSYYGSSAKNYNELAKQVSPYTLDKNSEYVIIAPFEDGKFIHYNEERDTVIILSSFEAGYADVYVASYSSEKELLDMKVDRNVASFEEVEVGYNAFSADVSGVLIYFWEKGSMKSAFEPFLIGTIG